MTSADFEKQVAEQFPAIAVEVAEYSELLHPVMGSLYGYSQTMIIAENWDEVERILRFLEASYKASQPAIEIENAIRVSFLEYFDFQDHESQIRRLFGSELEFLYDDQMEHMENLSRAAAAKIEADPDKGYWE